VQGNVSRGSRWRSAYYGQDLDVYLGLTLNALRQARPRIVFWPESSMTFFLEREPSYQRAIARVLAPFGAELVAGAPRASSKEGPPYFNSIYVMSPQGELVGRYDKEYLVPFGEYFPFGSIELLRRHFGKAREYSPAPAGTTLPTAAGPAGILTCNEAMLPEIASARVAAGAGYLVNPSNDTWIPDETFAELQFDIVSLRAIEQRRYLIRASTSGPSAIVDPYGRITGRTPTFTRETLLGEVRAQDGRTLYSLFGDAFAVGCLVLALGAWTYAGRRGPAVR
jgi:apolipoprotein N-acyltransferase